MPDYRPSQIVAKLAEKVGGIPIAEAIRLDGTVVIIFQDGRKLTFAKDDITRTLTESSAANADASGSQKTASLDALEGEGGEAIAPRKSQTLRSSARRQKGA
jgi:hypothetical protein